MTENSLFCAATAWENNRDCETWLLS